MAAIKQEFADLSDMEYRARDVVDRMALAIQSALLVQHAPAAVADNTIVETLAAIWADVLGLDGVTPDDDYFELGGDSDLFKFVATRTGLTTVTLSHPTGAFAVQVQAFAHRTSVQDHT